jgi:hypothetical protein
VCGVTEKDFMPVPPKSVQYDNVPQENEFWCWAAVASNVYNSMRKPGSPPMTQCDVAQTVGQDCQDPDSFPLANALTGPPQGGLGIWDGSFHRVTDFFQIISNELTGATDGAQEPVCAEVDFGADAGYIVHVVAITGIDPVKQMVWVADPFLGGASVEFPLADFLTKYYFSGNSNGVVNVLSTVLNKVKLGIG